MFRERPPLLSRRVERDIPDPPGWMRNWNHETDPATGPSLFQSWYFLSRPGGKDPPCLVNGSPSRGARDSSALVRRSEPKTSVHSSRGRLVVTRMEPRS